MRSGFKSVSIKYSEPKSAIPIKQHRLKFNAIMRYINPVLEDIIINYKYIFVTSLCVYGDSYEKYLYFTTIKCSSDLTSLKCTAANWKLCVQLPEHYITMPKNTSKYPD